MHSRKLQWQIKCKKQAFHCALKPAWIWRLKDKQNNLLKYSGMFVILEITIRLWQKVLSSILQLEKKKKKVWSSLCWDVWEVLWETGLESHVIMDVPQKQHWELWQGFSWAVLGLEYIPYKRTVSPSAKGGCVCFFLLHQLQWLTAHQSGIQEHRN